MLGLVDNRVVLWKGSHPLFLVHNILDRYFHSNNDPTNVPVA